MQNQAAKTTRRKFLRGLAATAAGAGAAAVFEPLDARAARKNVSQKPNILFIITDDQKIDEFGFINGKALTPNVDRLARDGMYCRRAYATTSVCTPSRYTCLTGRYASRSQDTRIRKGTSPEGQTWVHWNADVATGETNVAKTLKRAGYATGVVGKLHGFVFPKQPDNVNRKSDPRDPRVKAILEDLQKAWAETLKEHGFDYAGAMNRANLGSAKSLPDALRYHSPEWKAQAAVEFVDANKDRPWYLYYATTLTHGPSPLDSLKADPRITEAGFLDEPLDVQPPRKDVLERCKKAGLPDSLAGAAWLDDSIGALLKKLDETGQTDNTLIVYFNDHGADGGKGTLYETGVHTPVIFHWPGVIPHGETDSIIANVDFVPTILSAAGVAPPKDAHMDGMDLMPLLKGKVMNTRDALLCEIGHTRAVVTEKWKYLAFRVPPSRQLSKEENLRQIEEYHKENPARKNVPHDPEGRVTHIHRAPGGDGTERSNGLAHYAKHYFDPDQLYDLENDPGEQTNLAGDPKYKDVLAKMRQELKKQLQPLPGTFGEFKTDASVKSQNARKKQNNRV